MDEDVRLGDPLPVQVAVDEVDPGMTVVHIGQIEDRLCRGRQFGLGGLILRIAAAPGEQQHQKKWYNPSSRSHQHAPMGKSWGGL